MAAGMVMVAFSLGMDATRDIHFTKMTLTKRSSRNFRIGQRMRKIAARARD
jgi:hypothetical protein